MKNRHRGAPPGNTNALKHGLYSRTIQAILNQLGTDLPDTTDLTPEIHLLRAKLQELVDLGGNLELVLRATAMIARLITVHVAIELRLRPHALEPASQRPQLTYRNGPLCRLCATPIAANDPQGDHHWDEAHPGHPIFRIGEHDPATCLHCAGQPSP